MARAAPTDEQVQLRRRARRRLIGAVALATVVAVVLPWVLEHEPRPSDNEISIQIPSPDSGSFDPRLPPAQDAAQGRASEPKPAEGASAEAPQGDKEAASGAEQGRPLAADKGSDKPKAAVAESGRKSADSGDRSGKETGDGKQFVVQIAALADADKARGIQQELSTKGLKVYTERVKAGTGEVTRVRVGPFPSREAAEKERARLKALGFEGNVTPR